MLDLYTIRNLPKIKNKKLVMHAPKFVEIVYQPKNNTQLGY